MFDYFVGVGDGVREGVGVVVGVFVTAPVIWAADVGVTVTVTGLVGVVGLVMVGFGVCEGFAESVGVTILESFVVASVRIFAVMDFSGKSNNSCQYSAAFLEFSRFS